MLKLWTGALLALPLLLVASVHADPYPNDDQLSAYLGQGFNGDTIIPLRRLVGLGGQYHGRRVEFVSVDMGSPSGRADAELWINGRPVDRPQMVGQYTQQYYFYVPNYESIVGDQIQELQLHLRGNVFVNDVMVQLDSGYYNPPPPPPPTNQYVCTVRTQYGDFSGTGWDQNQALAGARDQCIRAINNARICVSAPAYCRPY